MTLVYNAGFAFEYNKRKFHKNVMSEAKFKEFDPRLKFKSRLKNGWFHLKLYSIFQDLSRRSIKPDLWQI